jgi:Uma2 family endonuclease
VTSLAIDDRAFRIRYAPLGYNLETELMVGAVRQNSPMLSVASFRTWLTSRPDEEHWELIEGVPMMMAPPNRRHQRIANNLENLLNEALRRHNPALVAYHDIGVNIVSTVPYDPEPDVAVIREEENSDPRYADRFYLVAEVLSDSDKDIIDSKRDIYRAHPSCTCILLVRQDRVEITVDHRTADGWRSQVLGAGDELALPEFGLTCPVKAVYRDTPLA